MNQRTIINCYKEMQRIRQVEEYIAAIYNNIPRPMHTAVHLYTGQEAVAVGVCSNLKHGDVVFSTHRNHGHYLAMGGNLNKMMAELYGKETGCCRGKGASMHLTDMKNGVAPSSAIVAGNVSIATGFALSEKIKGTDKTSVSFIGDGATEEGSVYESVSFAAIHHLPILYVIENNQYAINTPLSIREPNDDISKKFANIIDVSTCDGNDIEKVFCVSEKCISKVRNDQKPQMIVFDTYRWHGHDGIGDGQTERYRTSEQITQWRERDPLALAEKKYDIKDSLKEGIIKEIEDEIRDAVRFAEDSSFPDKNSLYEDVFVGDSNLCKS